MGKIITKEQFNNIKGNNNININNNFIVCPGGGPESDFARKGI